MAQYLVNVVGPTSTFVKSATGTGSNTIYETGEGYYSPFTPGSVAAINPVPVGSALAGGAVGTSYSETITAQGGTSPYTYAVTAGALPTGTTLTGSTGVISGTPSATGTYSFNITVTDTNSLTGTQGFSIAIAPAPSSGGGVSNYGYAG